MRNLINWNDVDGQRGAHAVATALFPDEPAEEKAGFWTEAARTVFAAILAKLVKDKKGNDQKLEKILALPPGKIFQSLPRGGKAAGYAQGGDRQASAVMYMITNKFFEGASRETGS